MNDDKSRQRLGRGLASLIGAGGNAAQGRPVPGFPDAAAPSGDRRVALDKLTRNPNNPRRNFDEAELAELSASIKVHGIVQPILVRPGQSGGFEIVAGERRWRAAQLAGLPDAPVVVREISDRESLEIAIIENVQRADLHVLEEAQAYQMLMDEHGYTQADLADVLGKSRSHVANTLRLLKLPAEVRDMVGRGELSAGHARTAVSAEDPLAFARQLVERGLSVREAEDLARGAEEPAAAGSAASGAGVRKRSGDGASKRKKSGSETGATAQKDADTLALERLLGSTLGMPVSITFAGEGGDIRIDYSNLEQLDEICRLLQARSRAPQSTGPRIRSL